MIKFLKNKKILKNDKGFTLIFAILVSVMVLAVGASIINISLKQVILSGAGRESQFAFYAANTGLECALYWDLNGLVVDQGTGQAKYVFPPAGGLDRDDGDFVCSGTNIETGSSYPQQSYTKAWVTTNGETESSTTFRLAISNDVQNINNVMYCAEVVVTKTTNNSDGSITTNIVSQGLNTCDPENDSRAVQRGLELQYQS